MKVLVTGFDPFGGESMNPSFEVVKRIKSTLLETQIIKLEVPTAFNVSTQKVIDKMEEEKPDYVLCLGQAGGRSQISIEKVAINLADARIPDNLAQQPMDVPIDEEGETAYFSTLPVKAIVEALQKKEIPAAISYTAGTYVCNHLMYGVLNFIKKKAWETKAGFIHIPFLKEQVANKENIPSMELDMMIQAVETAIEVMVSREEDLSAIGGEIS